MSKLLIFFLIQLVIAKLEYKFNPTYDCGDNEARVNCRFKEVRFTMNITKYSCVNTLDSDIFRNNSVIATVSKIPQKSNYSQVTGFVSNILERFKFFPKNLTHFFVNLDSIYVIDGRLKEIHKEDLEEFTKLKILRLENNDLEVIEGDLFEFNPLLEIIWLEDNRFKAFDVSSFKFLSNLKMLDLRPISGGKADSKDEIKKVLVQIAITHPITAEVKHLSEDIEIKRLKLDIQCHGHKYKLKGSNDSEQVLLNKQKRLELLYLRQNYSRALKTIDNLEIKINQTESLKFPEYLQPQNHEIDYSDIANPEGLNFKASLRSATPIPFDQKEFVNQALLMIFLPFTCFIIFAIIMICKTINRQETQHFDANYYEPSFTFTEVSDSEELESPNISIDDEIC